MGLLFQGTKCLKIDCNDGCITLNILKPLSSTVYKWENDLVYEVYLIKAINPFTEN